MNEIASWLAQQLSILATDIDPQSKRILLSARTFPELRTELLRHVGTHGGLRQLVKNLMTSGSLTWRTLVREMGGGKQAGRRLAGKAIGASQEDINAATSVLRAVAHSQATQESLAADRVAQRIGLGPVDGVADFSRKVQARSQKMSEPELREWMRLLGTMTNKTAAVEKVISHVRQAHTLAVNEVRMVERGREAAAKLDAEVKRSFVGTGEDKVPTVKKMTSKDLQKMHKEADKKRKILEEEQQGLKGQLRSITDGIKEATGEWRMALEARKRKIIDRLRRLPTEIKTSEGKVQELKSKENVLRQAEKKEEDKKDKLEELQIKERREARVIEEKKRADELKKNRESGKIVGGKVEDWKMWDYKVSRGKYKGKTLDELYANRPQIIAQIYEGRMGSKVDQLVVRQLASKSQDLKDYVEDYWADKGGRSPLDLERGKFGMKDTYRPGKSDRDDTTNTIDEVKRIGELRAERTYDPEKWESERRAGFQRMLYAGIREHANRVVSENSTWEEVPRSGRRRWRRWNAVLGRYEWRRGDPDAAAKRALEESLQMFKNVEEQVKMARVLAMMRKGGEGQVSKEEVEAAIKKEEGEARGVGRDVIEELMKGERLRYLIEAGHMTGRMARTGLEKVMVKMGDEEVEIEMIDGGEKMPDGLSEGERRRWEYEEAEKDRAKLAEWWGQRAGGVLGMKNQADVKEMDEEGKLQWWVNGYKHIESAQSEEHLDEIEEKLFEDYGEFNVRLADMQSDGGFGLMRLIRERRTVLRARSATVSNG